MTDRWEEDPNSMRRPFRITTAGVAGGNNFSTGVYKYDPAGNVTKMGVSPFVYDEVSRIMSGSLDQQMGDLKQSYSYDAFGNIQSITTTTGGSPVTRQTPTSSATNRQTGASYDSRGNVTAQAANTYAYDAFDQMHDSTIAGVRRNYVYSADDERISVVTTSPVTATWTLRDLSGQALRQFFEDPARATDFSWTKDWIRRGSSLIATEEPLPNGTHHMHLDHLGTPRLVTNSNKAQVSEHHYHPFGEEATAGGLEPMKFTGHERDLNGTTANSLDYMHARYCSPVQGRFLSVDPIGGNPSAPQSWNRYTYVLGNPLKFVDPDGESAVLAGLGSVGRVASAIVRRVAPGAVVGAGVRLGVNVLAKETGVAPKLALSEGVMDSAILGGVTGGISATTVVGRFLAQTAGVALVTARRGLSEGKSLEVILGDAGDALVAGGFATLAEIALGSRVPAATAMEQALVPGASAVVGTMALDTLELIDELTPPDPPVVPDEKDELRRDVQ